MTDYPQGASNEAKRALKHKKKNGSECGTTKGWSRARQLANRESLSETDIKSIHSFLSRAKVYDQTKFNDEDGNEICGSIMFAAWGGDSMVKWAARKAKEIQENKNAMATIEKRVAEIRMKATEEKSRKIVGYAAVFNKDSEDLGGFVERIAPGAFSEAIGISDVRALFNHDNNMVLARNTSGTLELIEDEKGLRYEFDAPMTSYGNDLLEMIKRGDVNQSSFGFTVKSDTWEEQEGKVYRTINKVNRLYDVSPVTFPAYPDASVAVRSMKEQFEENTTTTTEDFDGKLRTKIVKAAIENYS